MYYDISKILSYNAYFNFLIGERGVGKTFSSKKYVINKFLKKKEKFIYLRRFKTEIDKAKKSFFKDIAPQFEKYDFSCKGNTFYINDQICGYAVPLSTTNILKSVCFNDVTTIIFDEFIITKGCYHYLTDEVTTFLEFVETVFRMRDNVRVLFLGNAISQSNPYFLYFDLCKNPSKSNKDIFLYKDNLVLLQIMKNEEYRQAKKASKFGRLINNTSYGNYAIDNTFLLDNNNFIEKKKGHCRFLFSFIYKNLKFGVWCNYDLGKMYIDTCVDKSSPYVFSTTVENHEPNTLLLKNAKKYNCWNMLIQNFKSGNVYFENVKVKSVTMELLKIILT